MKRHLTSLALVLALVGTFVFGASNAAAQSNKGGAAGLVAAVVQIATDDVVEVEVVDSFNNLQALNNVLNNSPILSQNDIDVTVGDITVLEDFLNENDIDVTVEDFLKDFLISVDDVIGVSLLETGDLIIFV